MQNLSATHECHGQEEHESNAENILYIGFSEIILTQPFKYICFQNVHNFPLGTGLT
jgi:hypothetical protein